MTRSSLLLPSLLVLTLFATSGCEGLGRAMGLEKSSPDEFAVTAVAPLTLPPDYGLRPPHALGGRPATPAPSQEARTNLFPLQDQGAAAAASAQSDGEKALLTRASATNADPHIREQLDAEINGQTDASDSFIDSVMFWKSDDKTAKALEASGDTEGVDPQAESDRLKEAGVPGPHVERTDHTENDED